MKKPYQWGALLAVGVIIIIVLWWMPRAGLNPPFDQRFDALTRAPTKDQPPTSSGLPATSATAPSAQPTAAPLPTLTEGLALRRTDEGLPSPGSNCGSGGAEMLLPSYTPTPPAAAPQPTSALPAAGVTPSPTPDLTQLSQRAGFGMSTTASPEIWAGQLRSGWFLSWNVKLRSVSQIPEHWQMVRLRPNCYYPSKAYIRWVAAKYPGLVWIIGNEPDVIWQDSLTPEEYARVYHELYEVIKTADPNARLAVGAISQGTPLRLEYLDRVLKTYQAEFSQALPTDWWTVHGFVLREEHKSWGVEIPPGMTQERGELREVSDHGSMQLFKQQIGVFRGWMAANGYRDTPLALTEFGVLMPEEYGFSAQFVAEYMRESFAWLQIATDAATGYRADGNRLVQRWAWFSLADSLYPAPDLANLPAKSLTELGEVFRDYVLKYKP